jgi:hypothetical protein
MAGIRRYCGIAEEYEYGEAPAPAAVVHLDIASASLDAPSNTNIIYDGGARRTARIFRPGFYAPGGNIVYGLDVRTIGWFLKWALGSYKYTASGGTGSLNLHEAWGTEDVLLPSFCARVGKDIFEHVFSGCVVNSLQINVGSELCMATVDIAASKDSKSALEVGELLFPEEYPLAFHEVTAYLIGEGDPSGDLSISAKVKEFTLNINNSASADGGRHIGSRYPARIPAGDRETTLSLQLFYEDTIMLERLWGASTGPNDCGSEEYGIKLVLDTSPCEDHGKVEIYLPKVVNTAVSQQPSGRSETVQTVEARALMTDLTLASGEVEGEILCSIENNEEEMAATS